MLGLATVAHALGSAAVLAVAPLAPFLLDAFALSRAQAGLLLPAVYLGGVALSLPAGWLTERLGVRAPLAAGQALAGGAVILAAAAGGFPLLLALLLVGGFGFSVLNPTTGKAVMEWFGPRERGFAMGVKQAGLTLGGVASAVVLPPIASALGWRLALVAAGAAALLSAALVAVRYRPPAGAAGPVTPPSPPRLGDVLPFLRRGGVAVVFACGLALSVAQSSVLGHLALFARETFALSSVDAARVLALAHLGGAAGRLGWGFASDRLFGGRRRPGLIVNALAASATFGVFALGDRVPAALAIPAAVVAGAGAFGWVGLYFALVAEIGAARHAGLLTGLATVFAWSGVLVGPPLFGLLVDLADGYAGAWLALGGLTALVALALSRLAPLVSRD
jgi:ACS family hexuronate transporter-like MFS transporter